VSAAGVDWVRNGGPLFYAGNFYYPTGPTQVFDGNVMRQTGSFEGTPLYEDATLEPHSIVYVPIGGGLMRPYERRREGELAGTVGSRTPTFPVQPASSAAMRGARTRAAVAPTIPSTAPIAAPAPAASTSSDVAAVGTSGAAIAASRDRTAGPAPRLRPRASDGVWIEFQGTRWYSDGMAVSYDPDRFVPIGSYRGFPVYRDSADANRIFVTVAPDGPIAPFTRR
jgi:hypothetical protein